MNTSIQEEIENISQQIINKYKPKKIILFGSAVEGKMTQDSDLDFLIIKDDVPYRGIDRIRELLGLIEKHCAADFLVYRPQEVEELLGMGEPFLKTIFKKGKVLYGE